MPKSISRQISEFAIKLKYEDLPKEVVNEVKRYLYDSIGCAYGSYKTKDVKILRKIYKNIGGKKEENLRHIKGVIVDAKIVNHTAKVMAGIGRIVGNPEFRRRNTD